MYIFQIYHNFTKLRKNNVTSLTDSATWPDSWKTVYVKSYPRFDTTTLPPPQETAPKLPLYESIISRASTHKFTRHATLAQISSLLFYSIGEKTPASSGHAPHRMYPSAGARYPLEFYILILKKTGELAPGVYHYDITTHGLTNISNKASRTVDIQALVPQEYIQSAQFMVVFTAILSRGTPKYGERTYRFALLEAGAVMQNFGLVAAAHNIGAVNIAGVFDAELERVLDIDGTEETIVHSMFFG